MMGWLRTLRRRWILTLLLVLLTLAGTAALGSKPGPYQSQSQVVLLPSLQSSKANGNNPYLSFADSVSLTADLVRREVMAPATALALAAQGYPSTYQVVDDPNTAGPVLDVTVTGNSKAAVQNTLYAVTTEISTKLAAMQAGTKLANRITSLAVSVDPRAMLMISKKARTLVVVLGIGLLLTIAIPQVADAAITQRRSRRKVTGGESSVVWPEGGTRTRQSSREPTPRKEWADSSTRTARELVDSDYPVDSRVKRGNPTATRSPSDHGYVTPARSTESGPRPR